MTKSILITLWLFFCTPATYAADLPTSVRYIDQNFGRPTVYEAALDEAFERQGFTSTVMPGVNENGPALTWLNRVYSPPGNGRGQVFAKAGLIINIPVEYGQIYRLSGESFVTHLNGGVNGDIVIYFKQMSEASSKNLAKAALAALGRAKSKFSSLNFHLLPQAEAQSVNHFCEDVGGISYHYREAARMFASGGSCIRDVMRGVWDVTGGAVVSAGYAILHPIETGEKIWKQAKAAGNFLANFSEAFGEMKEQFKQLPSEVKGQILCELTGSIGTGAVISAFTAGAGGSALIGAMAKAVDRVGGKLGSPAVLALAAKLESRADEIDKTRRAAKRPSSWQAAENAARRSETLYEDAIVRSSKSFDAMQSLRRRNHSDVANEHKEIYQYRSERLATIKIKNRADAEGAFDLVTGTTRGLQRDYVLTPDVVANLKKIEDEINSLKNGGFSMDELSVRTARLGNEAKHHARMAVNGTAELVPPKGGWLNAKEIAEYNKAKLDSEQHHASMLRAYEEYAKDQRVLLQNPPQLGKPGAILVAGTGIGLCNAHRVMSQEPSSSGKKEVPASR